MSRISSYRRERQINPQPQMSDHWMSRFSIQIASTPFMTQNTCRPLYRVPNSRLLYFFCCRCFHFTNLCDTHLARATIEHLLFCNYCESRWQKWPSRSRRNDGDTWTRNMKPQILIQFDGEYRKSTEREMVRTHVLKTHLHLRLLLAYHRLSDVVVSSIVWCGTQRSRSVSR